MPPHRYSASEVMPGALPVAPRLDTGVVMGSHGTAAGHSSAAQKWPQSATARHHMTAFSSQNDPQSRVVHDRVNDGLWCTPSPGALLYSLPNAAGQIAHQGWNGAHVYGVQQPPLAHQHLGLSHLRPQSSGGLLLPDSLQLGLRSPVPMSLEMDHRHADKMAACVAAVSQLLQFASLRLLPDWSAHSLWLPMLPGAK
jgi:hypothetical protein